MLFEADVNYLAVVLAAIATQPLGALWYGPLFGERWMTLRGYTREDAGDPGSAYAIGFAAHLVMAYVLARLVDMVGAVDVGESIAIAAFVGSGFIVTVLVTAVVFSPRRSLPLIGIEAGYQFASVVAMGAIIGAFQ